MATSRLGRVIQTLRRATLPQAGLTDGQLLESYISSREEAAFAALVHRHGPMVWGVCRRVLRSHHDAEDAFQATFLVLVRKAASLAQREKVANWLYGVAHQTALKARATTAKRRAREKQVTAMPEPALERQDLCNDLLPLLDQELSRLPDKYREVIVLCDLEGKTRKEAARQFHLPEGTVATRLATARTMLARRLARPGLALSGGALAAVLSQKVASAGLPASVASSTIKAASLVAAGQAAAPGVISVKAVALAEGVLKAMLLTRLKIATAVLVVLAVLGACAAALTLPVQAEKSADRPVKEKKEGEKEIPEVSGIWPQWRGPNRDGVVHGVTVPKKWPKTLKEEWKVPVGAGYSSPVVVGGKVYVFARQKEDEVVLCFEVASGKEIWRSESYPAPYKPGPGAPGDKKARSTPAVAGGRVFTLGVGGILSCLDAKTGKLHWRKDFKQYPIYGASASPLVDDGLCITQVGKGGLTAFDVATGEVKWCYDDVIGGPAYGSPILVELAGERQVVTVTQGHFLGVSAATGKLLWRLHVPRWDLQQCITPVRYKDLIIFADSGEPLRAIRLEKGDKGITAKEVWKAEGHTRSAYHMSSPVLAGDRLFGFSGQKSGHLFCLDAKTGQTLWQSDGRLGGHASILNAGSVWLVLTNAGRLIVVKPSGTSYEPIAEYRVADRGADAHPVFLGDRVLIRDDSTLRSFWIDQDAAAHSTAQANGRKQTSLDLQPRANQQLKEDFGRAGNNLAALPTGEQTLAGVKWKIGEGLIRLSGKSTTNKPEKVEGVSVGMTFSKLYFLHATHCQAPEDTLVGYYTVTYEDKSRHKIPIVYGKDVSDWWYKEGSTTPGLAEVAWNGEIDSARNTNGSRIRLYKSTWDNPVPARKVVSIDFASTNGADAAPFCVAITGEE
jgi:RNA polymerase sigma factor (sigma-70 family)